MSINTNTYFSYYPQFFKENRDKLISLSKDKLSVNSHPEAVITEFNSTHPQNCSDHDNVYTPVGRFLSGDESFVCTVGKDICLKLNGTASFELLLKAAKGRIARMRDALAKNRAELKSAATLLASATDSAAQASALESVADVIKFKVGGRARTKKVQGSLLGSLAYLYKLDEKLVRQLSDKLGVPLTYNKFTLHQMYGTLQKEYRRAHDEIKETLKSDDTFSVDNVEAVLDQLKSNQFGFSLYNYLLKKEGGKEERLLAKLKERYESLKVIAATNFKHNLSTLQRVYRDVVAELAKEGKLKTDDTFSIENTPDVVERLKKNSASSLLYDEVLAEVGDDVDELLSNMKKRFDMLSANGSATLQKLYRDAVSELTKEGTDVGGDPFSSEYFSVVEERLNMNPESATLLKEQLAKVGDDVDELLSNMKERYETLSANGSATYEANFENDLSILQSLYHNALTEDERKGGDFFSSNHFKAVEGRLKMNPESATLLKEQLAGVGDDVDELLIKMKERFDTLSTSGNQYISHTSEGDIVNEILQYRFRGDLVLETTIAVGVKASDKTWDGFKRLVEYPNPLDTNQTMGDLLGLNDVTEGGLNKQILRRAGHCDPGHSLEGVPFHLLTVTTSEPGKYFVNKLGYKEEALQVWSDAVQVWKSNQSDSVLDLYAEPATIDMDIDELRERHLGKVANIINRSGDKAYTEAQKVHLMEMINPLKNALREYIISTSRGNVYQKPTLDQAVDVLSDALKDTTLQFSGFSSIAAGAGEGARSLSQVITGEMNRDDKQQLKVNVNQAGKAFNVVIYPKSSHDLARMEILAICIVLNKTVGFDKEERTTKQDTLVEICK